MAKLTTLDDPIVIIGTSVILGCQVCERRLTARSPGYLWIDNYEVADRQVRRREANRRVRERAQAEGLRDALWSAADLDDLPPVVRWQVHHSTCDPAPDAGYYSIQFDRIDTVKKLLHWTGHLMRKDWLGHTNWAAMIDRASRGLTGDAA